MDVLHEQFPDMARGGDVNWPPRSCDLTFQDFFLWGFLKSQLYANKPKIQMFSKSTFVAN